MTFLPMLVAACMINAVCPEGSALRCKETARRIVTRAEALDVNATNLLTLAAIESGFDPNAASDAGAVGVLQVTEIAEAEVNQRYGTDYDRSQVSHNIRIGALYWRLLRQQFNGNVSAMVAAYNAGPARVMQYLKEGRPLPFETENHVRKFEKLRKQCEVRAWKK